MTTELAYLSPLRDLMLVVEPSARIPAPSALASMDLAAVALHQADGNPVGSVTVVYEDEARGLCITASGPIICPRECLDAWAADQGPRLTVVLSDGLRGEEPLERTTVMPEEMITQLLLGVMTLGGEIDPDAALNEHGSHGSDAARLQASQVWWFK